MRNIDVLIINRHEGSERSRFVNIIFNTVKDFMSNTDAAIDETPFRKVDLEFETDSFTVEEIEILKNEGFLF